MIPSASYPPVAEDESRYITASPIDVGALLASAHHPSAGAIVLFSGEVRNHSNGKTAEYLDYEAHIPLASKMIREILDFATDKWQLKIAIAVHRVGRVAISEPAVVVITASSHREEAYAANRYIIDRIKYDTPIWKCEYFDDGSSQWGKNSS